MPTTKIKKLQKKYESISLLINKIEITNPIISKEEKKFILDALELALEDCLEKINILEESDIDNPLDQDGIPYNYNY
jgi:hypothetical protein